MTGNMKPSREAVCWCFCSLVPSGSRGQQRDAAILKQGSIVWRLCPKAGPEEDLKRERAAFLSPLLLSLGSPLQAAPASAPCPSLPCLLPRKAAEGLLLLLGATKNFDTFCIKLGSPDRGRQDTGQWLPRFLPTTLAAMSCTWMKQPALYFLGFF